MPPDVVRPEAADFGLRLKAARKRVGLTQTDLAIRAGVHLRQVMRYESGESLPPEHRRKKIAEMLDEPSLATAPQVTPSHIDPNYERLASAIERMEREVHLLERAVTSLLER